MMAKNNVIDINENEHHKVSEVICVNCKYRWLAVRPVVTRLRDIECPRCGLQAYVIETGETISEEEK